MYIIYINNVKNWDVYGKKKRERKQHEYETIWWMNGTDLICKETKESYEKSLTERRKLFKEIKFVRMTIY